MKNPAFDLLLYLMFHGHSWCWFIEPPFVIMLGTKIRVVVQIGSLSHKKDSDAGGGRAVDFGYALHSLCASFIAFCH